MGAGGETPDTQEPRPYRWWQYQPLRSRRSREPQQRRAAPRLADMRPGDFFGGLFLVVVFAVVVGVLAAFWITAVVITQRFQVLPPAPTSTSLPTFPIP